MSTLHLTQALVHATYFLSSFLRRCTRNGHLMPDAGRPVPNTQYLVPNTQHLIPSTYITSSFVLATAMSICSFSSGGSPGMSTLMNPRTMVAVASSSVRPLAMR